MTKYYKKFILLYTRGKMKKEATMKKQEDTIYPVRIDSATYKELKEYAENHGRQSVQSVIFYAITLFLKEKKEKK